MTCWLIYTYKSYNNFTENILYNLYNIPIYIAFCVEFKYCSTIFCSSLFDAVIQIVALRLTM